MVVDTNVFLIVVMITADNMHNSKATRLPVQILKNVYLSVKTIIPDGDYSSQFTENIKMSSKLHL